jgi:hypothetical protein
MELMLMAPDLRAEDFSQLYESIGSVIGWLGKWAMSDTGIL